MSALAKLLSDDGHIVKGLDFECDYYTKSNLYNICIDNFENYKLSKNYVYIIGNAYINHYLSQQIRYLKFKCDTYSEFIVKYFSRYQFIAVAGSHGKTTTCKMLNKLLLDSSYIIGDGSGGGGNKDRVIVEACEYKNTFLNYEPDISIVLNADYDHPDYFKNKEEYINSFQMFINKSKLAIVNGDEFDINGSKIITFGIKKDNDVVFKYRIKNKMMEIIIFDSIFKLNFVGKHLAYDFVAAYIVARISGLSDEDIKIRMLDFKMPKRRMERIKMKNVEAMIDYAHHPTEIMAIHDMMRQVTNKKLVCIFEPHTLSRTKAFINEFKESLSLFDEVYLLPIFSSIREEKDMGKESAVYNQLDFNKINSVLDLNYDEDKYYLFLGAGNIDKMVKCNMSKIIINSKNT